MAVIPTIVLTSPNTIEAKVLETGDEYSSSNCKMATPNTMFILQTLSPLGNHQVLGRGKFGCVIESYYKSEYIIVQYLHCFMLYNKKVNLTGKGRKRDWEGMGKGRLKDEKGMEKRLEITGKVWEGSGKGWGGMVKGQERDGEEAGKGWRRDG